MLDEGGDKKQIGQAFTAVAQEGLKNYHYQQEMPPLHIFYHL